MPLWRNEKLILKNNLALIYPNKFKLKHGYSYYNFIM